jgi:hypothetical protein
MHRKFTGSQIIYRNCVADIYNLFYFSYLKPIINLFNFVKKINLNSSYKDYNLLKIFSRVSIHSILIEK